MGTNTQNSYKYLNRAQLSINYLHSNSTTHEFLFGALAEMIDNSRDANAKNIHVFTESHPNLRGGHMLCFLDDGCGMNPTEARDIMTFGRSFKKDDLVGNERKMIGQYGNGLKSGSMRIGHDFILFTKCQNHPMTCLMLSRTFHEEEKIDEVIVPSPSFNTETLQLFYDDDEDLKEKAELELSLILKYSPFQTMTDLMARFCSINGPSGTLVCVYTLKLDTSGNTELDFLSYPTDILLAKPSSEHTGDESTALLDEESYVPLGKPLVNAKLINGTLTTENSTVENRNETRNYNLSEKTTSIKDLVELTGEPLEKVSLRAYLAMLYFGLGAYSSRMLTSDANRDDCSLWLRNSRVSRIHWLHWLYKYKRYTYTCNKFKAKAESDYKKTLNESKIAEEIAREAESKERDMRKRYGSTLLDKQKRMELRKALEHAKSLRRKADLLKQSAEKKQKSLKDPKSLDLIFGLNVNHRSRNGAFIYNQGRLIKLYQPFNNHPISSIKNNGVVCLVDIPYELLEPTHNKQDFADEKEWKLLKNVINTHFNDYISDIIDFNKSTEYKNWKEFWKFYGYETDDQIIPNHSSPYNMRRLMIIPKYKQCARCMKFRKIPFQTIPSTNVNSTSSDSCGIEFMIETGDEFWECAQNIDRKANRCEIPEQKVEIPLAKLRKTLPNNNNSNTTNIQHNKSSLALGTATKSNHKRIESFDQEDTPSDENEGDDDSFRPGRDRKRPNYRERSLSPPLSTMEDNSIENVEIQQNSNNTNNHKISSNNLPSSQMNTVESALASLRRPPNLMPNTSRIKNEYESQNSSIGSISSLNGPPSVLNAETLLDNVSNDILATNSKILSPKKSNTSTKNSYLNNNHTGTKRKNTTNAYKTSHSGSFSSKNSIDNSRIHKLEDKLTRLSDQLKEILKYFTPPNYHFTAEDVDRFDIDSLINLNLSSLKNQYQEEIKKLIEKEAKTKCNSSSSLQDNKMYEKTIADYKLLRKNVSNMLILANLNNCELPPDCQTEKVDEIVQSLVQTLQQP